MLAFGKFVNRVFKTLFAGELLDAFRQLRLVELHDAAHGAQRLAAGSIREGAGQILVAGHELGAPFAEAIVAFRLIDGALKSKVLSHVFLQCRVNFSGSSHPVFFVFPFKPI